MPERSEQVARCFGESLRDARRRARLSQGELGDRAALDRAGIGLLERGQRVPRLDTVLALAKALSVEPADLIAEIE